MKGIHRMNLNGNSGMNVDYWLGKWDRNEIGFHAAKVNKFLAAHIGALNLPAGARVFVPLCGKTRDMGWLLEQGFEVVGAELSELAIVQLFEDLALVPEIAELGDVKWYSGTGITVFVCDIFDVRGDMLGEIAAVYDRAALVALPEVVRADYVDHVARITGGAPQILLTFEYDQAAMTGPPFSITVAMVEALFAPQFEVQLLEDATVEGGFKGRIPAVEKAWVLRAARA